MANCSQAILSIGTYKFVIYGTVTTEDEFNSNVKWITGKDSNNQSVFGSKPDEVTWTKVKADMDKQDAFVSQDEINKTAKEENKLTPSVKAEKIAKDLALSFQLGLPS